MKWQDGIKSMVGSKEAGEKVFDSLVEAAEYAKKHPGGAHPNPFEKNSAEIPAKTENRWY